MKTKSFVLHDESVNTQGFRMLTSGGDLSVFRNNPVLLLNHDDYDLPVGRWENIRVEGTRVLADAVFDEEDEKAMRIAGKVERGFLRMASIGAWPQEVSDDEALKLPGQTLPTIVKWIAREGSICTIGSNHNALALYDRENNKIDLTDPSGLIKLFDECRGVQPDSINKKSNRMSKLTNILKLSDNASEEAVSEEVEKVLRLNDRLKTENASLKTDKDALTQRLQVYETKEKEARKNEAIALTDAAIRESRINAQGKDSWLADFEKDFDGAKLRLSSIAARETIADKLIPGSGKGAVSLADKTFQEILKEDRLKELKAEKELYRQKFFEAFGKYPQ